MPVKGKHTNTCFKTTSVTAIFFLWPNVLSREKGSNNEFIPFFILKQGKLPAYYYSSIFSICSPVSELKNIGYPMWKPNSFKCAAMDNVNKLENL